MSDLHLLYVPGLGDSQATAQTKAIATWRRWGVTPELFRMNWDDGAAWEPKFASLLARIDAIVAAGDSLGLVGASAGASAVINAFAARKDVILGCVLIAGKVNNPGSVGERFKSKSPAFWTSIQLCQSSLATLSTEDRRRIMSRYGLVDEMVSVYDSRVKGAVNRVVPTIGHVVNIGGQLVFGAPAFIRFLRKHETPKVAR